MNHQDWKTVCFTKKKPLEKKLLEKKTVVSDEHVKIEAAKKLGLMISKGRLSINKSQKEFAFLLGVTQNIVKNWENNTVTPSNLQIAQIEKFFPKVTLPRNKKVKIVDK